MCRRSANARPTQWKPWWNTVARQYPRTRECDSERCDIGRWRFHCVQRPARFPAPAHGRGRRTASFVRLGRVQRLLRHYKVNLTNKAIIGCSGNKTLAARKFGLAGVHTWPLSPGDSVSPKYGSLKVVLLRPAHEFLDLRTIQVVLAAETGDTLSNLVHLRTTQLRRKRRDELLQFLLVLAQHGPMLHDQPW